MLTAEVLALTTRVDRQVAARTPPVRVVVSVLTWSLPRNTLNLCSDQRASTSGDSSRDSSFAGVMHLAADDRRQSVGRPTFPETSPWLVPARLRQRPAGECQDLPHRPGGSGRRDRESLCLRLTLRVVAHTRPGRSGRVGGSVGCDAHRDSDRVLVDVQSPAGPSVSCELSVLAVGHRRPIWATSSRCHSVLDPGSAVCRRAGLRGQLERRWRRDGVGQILTMQAPVLTALRAHDV